MGDLGFTAQDCKTVPLQDLGGAFGMGAIGGSLHVVITWRRKALDLVCNSCYT